MTAFSRAGALERELSALQEAGLRRELRETPRPAGVETEIEGRRLVNFGSNNYLSLAGHPEVVAAAIEATRLYGASPAASRLISGNHPLNAKLEKELAALKNSASALIFSSGYLANIGAIPAMVGRDDGVALDRLGHASLVDGCRLSGARMLVYPHNDAAGLERILKRRRAKFKRMLIVTEGIFSMDGDLGNLRELLQIAERFDAWLFVDDAHGTGVMGREGRGAAEELDVPAGERLIQMGTLSKALGSTGGFIAACGALRDILINRARGLIYETGIPAAAVAAASAALGVMRREPWRRERLRGLAKRVRMRLREMGMCVLDGPSPIVPVIAGENAVCMDWMRRLRDEGIFVPAIRPPTVPAGKARMRLSLQAGHSDEQIGQMLDAFSRLPRTVRA